MGKSSNFTNKDYRAFHEMYDKKVLDIIKDNTFETVGIGRTAIYVELCNRGIKISDDKLRKILKSLENDGKITIGKGRVGCRSI